MAENFLIPSSRQAFDGSLQMGGDICKVQLTKEPRKKVVKRDPARFSNLEPLLTRLSVLRRS